MAGATLSPPPHKQRAPLADAMRAQAVRAVQAPEPTPELGAPAVRAAFVLASAAYALNQWLNLLQGRPRHALGAAVVIGALLATALVAAGRVRRLLTRAALTVGALVVAALAAVAAAGAPGAALAPRGWGDLVTGIGNGLSALPALTVPYQGTDQWARVVLAAGGILLVLAAVALATWPRRRRPGSRAAALAALGVLYAVPAVELNFAHPWGVGAVFAILLVAAMHGERLRPSRAPAALAVVGVAVLGGLVVAPRIDGSRPIVDVQKLASRLEVAHQVTFSWNHRYGPLTWPRDGRVLLRVKARHQAYWKAETLDRFDGARWVSAPNGGGDAWFAIQQWTEHITVTLAALRTTQFVGAGTTKTVADAPRTPVGGTSGALISSDGPLQNGDEYNADVYYPTPSDRQLHSAGFSAYRDPRLVRDLVVGLPGPRRAVTFPAWGQPPSRDAARALGRSPYARAYALASDLRARARTPYDFVIAVQDHLLHGYTYDEAPAVHRFPLASFLFDDPRGYCQQFSGAMALLLRMGGVPARVAAGFSPGVFDASRGEYVVRDFDAHSWVEAFFPNIGWVTFDPTPAASPAQAQLDDKTAGADSTGRSPLPTGSEAGTAAESGRFRARSAPTPWWRRPLVIVAALLVLAAAVAASLSVRRDRRRPPSAPELAELERALRLTGRDGRPPTTLRDLERLLGPDPAAAAYVTAVRRIRYAGGGAGPTPAERRALRHALGEGLGVRGRLRALRALPPQPKRRRSLN